MDKFLGIKCVFVDNILLEPPIGQSIASYHPKCIVNSKDLMQELIDLPEWERLMIKVCGRDAQQNRYSCFFASSPNLNYRYSGVNSLGSQPFPEAVNKIRLMVQKEIYDKTRKSFEFNFCLLNKYQNGTDNIGWHSDDERSLDAHAPIASVSLGASRFFDVWESNDHKRKVRTELHSGDMVVMWPPMQKHYQHSVPTQKTITNIRVNLTFRVILPK